MLCHSRRQRPRLQRLINDGDDSDRVEDARRCGKNDSDEMCGSRWSVWEPDSTTTHRIRSSVHDVCCGIHKTSWPVFCRRPDGREEFHTPAVADGARHRRRNVRNPGEPPLRDGRSDPRSHQDREPFPVTTFTYSLNKMVEIMSEKPDKAKITTNDHHSWSVHQMFLRERWCRVQGVWSRDRYQ